MQKVEEQVRKEAEERMVSGKKDPTSNLTQGNQKPLGETAEIMAKKWASATEEDSLHRLSASKPLRTRLWM